jgi:hypothetical protein
MKKKLLILPSELFEAVKQSALKNNRSVNKEIVNILELALNK